MAIYNLPDTEKVHMVTIIPRGDAGGFTMHRPTTDDRFKTKKQLFNNIVVSMGGRVAEAIVFDDITWGASADIQSATRTAKTMVTRLGFSEKLGPVLYGGSNDEPFVGMDYGHAPSFSDTTAALIDEEVKRLVNEAYDRCEKILTENMDQLKELAEYLLVHEKIDGDKFEQLMKGELDWRNDADTNTGTGEKTDKVSSDTAEITGEKASDNTGDTNANDSAGGSNENSNE